MITKTKNTTGEILMKFSSYDRAHKIDLEKIRIRCKKYTHTKKHMNE